MAASSHRARCMGRGDQITAKINPYAIASSIHVLPLDRSQLGSLSTAEMAIASAIKLIFLLPLEKFDAKLPRRDVAIRCRLTRALVVPAASLQNHLRLRLMPTCRQGDGCSQNEYAAQPCKGAEPLTKKLYAQYRAKRRLNV